MCVCVFIYIAYTFCIQVPGYLVYGTGQPTKLGFSHAIQKIFDGTGGTDGVRKVLWTNMRQVLWPRIVPH